MARVSVTAGTLRPGDRTTGSGILITSVSAGVRTPSGKVDVFGIRRNGNPFVGCWNKRTRMVVERKTATDADNEADALVNPNDALAAYRGPDGVLGNDFIDRGW